MTELQKLRKLLMKKLKDVENGETTDKEVNSMVSLSNGIIKSYNVELRADELSIKNKDKKDDIAKNKVFKNVKDDL